MKHSFNVYLPFMIISSIFSISQEPTTKDSTPPTKVGDLQSRHDKKLGRFVLSWKEGQDADIGAYVVKGNDGGDFDEWMTKGSAVKPPFTFMEPCGNKRTIRLRVYAVDTSGNRGEPSDEVRVELPDEVRPTISSVEVQRKAKSLVIKWQSPDPDVRGAFIEKSDSPRRPFKRINEKPIEASQFEDIDVSPGNSYRYRVVLVDESGYLSAKSQPVSGSVVDTEPPARPAKPDGELKDGVVVLTWQTNSEKDVKGFVVEVSYGKVWYVRGSVNPQCSFEDRRVPGNLKKIWYRIKAVDNSKNISEPSEPVEVNLVEK